MQNRDINIYIYTQIDREKKNADTEGSRGGGCLPLMREREERKQGLSERREESEGGVVTGETRGRSLEWT